MSQCIAFSEVKGQRLSLLIGAALFQEMLTQGSLTWTLTLGLQTMDPEDLCR